MDEHTQGIFFQPITSEQKNEIIKEHQDELNQRCTTAELIDYLSSKFDMKEITTNLNNKIISHLKEKVTESLYNINHLKEEDLNIKVFEITNNTKSEIYYQELDCELVVIFEEKTQYVDASHYKLRNELMIKRGLSQDEIEKSDLLLMSYLYLKEHQE